MNNTLIGVLGSRLDHAGLGKGRLTKWRPSVALVMHDDLPIATYFLFYLKPEKELLDLTVSDISHCSPDTLVVPICLDCEDPWDLEMVYGSLIDAIASEGIGSQGENFYVNITTGTHVVQICMFLLVEAKILPAKLIQSSPSKDFIGGVYQVIDLNLSKYDKIASRFAVDAANADAFLKNGIVTNNVDFNRLISQIERVSIKSVDPILLMGPTGSGKTQLAKRIYELKKNRGQISGSLVSVNCATLGGDGAMSALFGHSKGSFTGALSARHGLLREAHNGLLFLDEIGELPLNEQAMLLKAIEEKQFYPVGADKPVSSDFIVIAGTNIDLSAAVSKGIFRQDLLARINIWTYKLPSLKNRMEDFEPNLEYELKKINNLTGRVTKFTKSARESYVNFAKSSKALWVGNFRDLNASVRRMSTLSDNGIIVDDGVNEEIERLSNSWLIADFDERSSNIKENFINGFIENIGPIDRFDLCQLAHVLDVCLESESLAGAGRKLFDYSRMEKSKLNDSHRLKQYLKKFGVDFFDFINLYNDKTKD